jgi:hypothetical protein
LIPSIVSSVSRAGKPIFATPFWHGQTFLQKNAGDVHARFEIYGKKARLGVAKAEHFCELEIGPLIAVLV